MVNAQVVNRSELIENISWKLLEVVDQDTLETFFQEKHVEWYRESDDQTLLEDAYALGVLDPDAPVVLTESEDA